MNTLKQAIETYGEDKQKVVAMEELAELQKELSKSIRGEGNIAHISEEMADVEIMLEQLKLMYGNRDAVAIRKTRRIKQLQNRLCKIDKLACCPFCGSDDVEQEPGVVCAGVIHCNCCGAHVLFKEWTNEMKNMDFDFYQKNRYLWNKRK